MTMISHRVLLALVLLAPASASADAIMPFDGECFPGSRRGISNHAEACIPIVCESDGDCGEGARCQTLCTCSAERQFQSDGRIVYPEPVTRVVEIGFCDAAGACAEGTVGSRKQCEPTASTPAFDGSTHRWTGRTHEGGGLFGGGDDDEGEDESSPGEATPSGGACAGCAVPRGGAPGALVLALAGVALVSRRRRG